MPAFDELRVHHSNCSPSCIQGRCENSGCIVNLQGIRSVCINCDNFDGFRSSEPGKQTKIPDFIVLPLAGQAPSPYWFVIEMKPSHKVSEIVEQLQEGSRIIERHSKFQITNRPANIVPLVVATNGVHSQSRDQFRSHKIIYRNVRHDIIVRRCGIPLIEILNGLMKYNRPDKARS